MQGKFPSQTKLPRGKASKQAFLCLFLSVFRNLNHSISKIPSEWQWLGTPLEQRTYNLPASCQLGEIRVHSSCWGRKFQKRPIKGRTVWRALGCHFCLWQSPLLNFNILKIPCLTSSTRLSALFFPMATTCTYLISNPQKSCKCNIPTERDLILSNTKQEQFIMPLALMFPPPP